MIPEMLKDLDEEVAMLTWASEVDNEIESYEEDRTEIVFDEEDSDFSFKIMFDFVEIILINLNASFHR